MVNFEVGTNEKHTVSFDYDTMWGKIKISVDGNEQTSTRKMVIGKTPFLFQVGDEEKHEVKIELNNPLGFAFRGSDMKAYIDGKLVHEEHIGTNVLMIFVFVLIISGFVYIVLS